VYACRERDAKHAVWHFNRGAKIAEGVGEEGGVTHRTLREQRKKKKASNLMDGGARSARSYRTTRAGKDVHNKRSDKESKKGVQGTWSMKLLMFSLHKAAVSSSKDARR
jgi:hypothetical protein